MTKERLLQSIKLHWLKGQKRNYYMKKVFGGFGENISYFPTIMPLYPELIKFHNNIVVASGVSFCTHDAIHKVLNVCVGGEKTEHLKNVLDVLKLWIMFSLERKQQFYLMFA